MRVVAQGVAGLSDVEAEALGPELAAQVRSFRLLHHLGQRVQFLADRLYEADGVTAQQAMLMNLVQMLGRPSLRELARAFGTSHQNAKQIASALVRKGFVAIIDDPDDGRVRRVAVTPKGRRYWAGRDGADFAQVATWFAGLSADEVAQLLALLQKLAESVRAAVDRVEGATPPARGGRAVSAMRRRAAG
jgi:DNA-binding MarR family transcriptional regulator